MMGEESQSEHDDETLKWTKPQPFERQSRDDEVMWNLDNLKWKSPSDRKTVPSDPEQGARFEPDLSYGDYAKSFVGDLPIHTFCS